MKRLSIFSMEGRTQFESTSKKTKIADVFTSAIKMVGRGKDSVEKIKYLFNGGENAVRM